MQTLLVALLLAGVAVAAPTYNATLAAVAIWPLSPSMPAAIGVVDLSASTNSFVPTAHDSNSVLIAGAGAIGDGLFAVVQLPDPEQLTVSVYDTHADGKVVVDNAKVTCHVDEIQCSPVTRRCYGVVLEHSHLVMFDPMAHPVRCVVVANCTNWISLLSDSSAFDDGARVYYATMSTITSNDTLVAFDVRRGAVAAVPGKFAQQTDGGPYCVDPRFGLLAVNTALGGLAALNTTTGAVTVLRKATLSSFIPETLVCRNGVLAVGGYDRRVAGHPFRLQAWDIYAILAEGSQAAPFYDAVPAFGGALLQPAAFANVPVRPPQ